MAVTVDDETIAAAGYAARGLETGRRVGWAKAFDYMRRADSAERDVNVLRADVRILCAFAARSYGALVEILNEKGANELFQGDNHELKSYFPDGPYRHGQDAARRVIANNETRIVTLRQQATELRKINQSLSDRIFQVAKRKALGHLADAFGFNGLGQMFDFLATSPTHDCAKLGCYAIPESGDPARYAFHFMPNGEQIDSRGWKI